jgi:hypothetical protein
VVLKVPLGAKLTDGRLGVVIDTLAGNNAKYALVASGTASLVGVSGLTLSGSMEAQSKSFGKRD